MSAAVSSDVEAESLVFARLLTARPDVVRLLDRDNRSRQAAWPERTPGQPFAVYLARGGRFRTVALDFDAKSDRGVQAARDAEIAAWVLRRFGVPAVVVESGPGGGRHVLATVTGEGLAAGEARRLVEALRRLPLPSLDPTPMLNPQTGCIRAPLSRHRLGGRSGLLDDHVTVWAALSTGASPEQFRSLIRALPDLDPARRRPLRRPHSDGSLTQLLRLGPRPARYASDSEAVQALATSYVNRGRTLAEFRAALAAAHPRSPVGRAYAKRGDEGDQWAGRCWTAAVRFVRAHPARPSQDEPDDQDVLDAWPAALAAVRLPKSARRAAEALHRLAVTHDRVLVGLSVRDLAERIGVSTTTAAKAFRDLRAAGLIEVAGTAAAGRAVRYRLRSPDTWSADIARTVSSSTYSGGVRKPTVRPVSAAALALAADLGHDAWRHRGLGESGRRAYQLLAHQGEHAGDGGVSIADVAQTTGVSVRQTRRILRRLAEHGLARREPDGRWTVEQRDGDAVAHAVGTAGTGREQRIRHAAERLGWRLRRTVRAADPPPPPPVAAAPAEQSRADSTGRRPGPVRRRRAHSAAASGDRLDLRDPPDPHRVETIHSDGSRRQ